MVGVEMVGVEMEMVGVEMEMEMEMEMVKENIQVVNNLNK
jgi:hypothetical protein